MPRYMRVDLWNTFFFQLLNIESCDKLPDLLMIKNSFESIISEQSEELQMDMRNIGNSVNGRWTYFQFLYDWPKIKRHKNKKILLFLERDFWLKWKSRNSLLFSFIIICFITDWYFSANFNRYFCSVLIALSWN